MKNALNIIKWLAEKARPFIFSLLSIMFFKILIPLCGIGIAVESKKLMDAASSGLNSQAVQAALIFIVFILLDTAIDAASSILSAKTIENVSNGMRKDIFYRLSHTKWLEFSQYHSDDIMTRLTSDVRIVSEGIAGILPDVISLIFGIAASFITLMIYDPILAVLAFVLGPVSILLSRIFGTKLKEMHIRIQESESSYRSLLHELIQNMIAVKAFCVEKESANRVSKLQDERMKWVIKRSRLNAFSGSVLSLGFWAGFFLAFGWGAMRLSQGLTTFGTITAFLQLVDQIQGPFMDLAETFPQAVSAIASGSRLMELENIELENYDGEQPAWNQAGICMDKVSFSYGGGNTVLLNISFEIYEGEMAALTGLSGEGKTTLIRLMLSLIQPEGGHIYFTGRGGKVEACSSTRKLVSYVPQENMLFSGTIAENLRFGNDDASDMEIEEAVRASCAWEFIQSLPEGIHTSIGENGIGLSAGQAQRIAIARALIKKAPVLILDEATSALDVETEIRVLQSIKNSNPKRTCIVITHRPSAAGICHRVLELKDGVIVEGSSDFIEAQASEAV